MSDWGTVELATSAALAPYCKTLQSVTARFEHRIVQNLHGPSQKCHKATHLLVTKGRVGLRRYNWGPSQKGCRDVVSLLFFPLASFR